MQKNEPFQKYRSLQVRNVHKLNSLSMSSENYAFLFFLTSNVNFIKYTFLFFLIYSKMNGPIFVFFTSLNWWFNYENTKYDCVFSNWILNGLFEVIPIWCHVHQISFTAFKMFLSETQRYINWLAITNNEYQNVNKRQKTNIDE